MKILITGGNGFIARNLFEKLRNEYQITAPGSKELNLLNSSKVYNYLSNNRFDAIIHTATYDAAPKTSIKDPLYVLENNLKMFFNIARCKDYFGRMIYFGSGAEFDRENWIPRMKEDYFDHYVPSDQYGFSKYIMTKYTQSKDNIYNLRLFGVFGKYEDYRYRFISNACYHAILDRPIRINQNVYFDYMYINDLVMIVNWFIKENPNENVYNVCTGNVYDLKTLGEKIINISCKKLDIEIQEKGFGREYSGDNTLIMSELKGFRFTPIEESLRDVYNWYLSNKNIFINNTGNPHEYLQSN